MNYQFYDMSNLPHRSSYRGGGNYDNDLEAVEQGLDYGDRQGFTLGLITQGNRVVWTLRNGLGRYNRRPRRFFEWGELTANDKLSRAASAVARINREHSEAAEFDAGFDGGEFSGPAHYRAAEQEIRDALQSFGFTPKQYNDELTRRGCGRFAHFNNLFTISE